MIFWNKNKQDILNGNNSKLDHASKHYIKDFKVYRRPKDDLEVLY
jgi:hypothetical protein